MSEVGAAHQSPASSLQFPCIVSTSLRDVRHAGVWCVAAETFPVSVIPKERFLRLRNLSFD